jgi:hypothetical protein
MFISKDFQYLEDVFALARLQSVNADPKNKQQLNALLAIEGMFASKMNETNTKLGFSEPEPQLKAVEKEESVEEESPVAQD